MPNILKRGQQSKHKKIVFSVRFNIVNVMVLLILFMIEIFIIQIIIFIRNQKD